MVGRWFNMPWWDLACKLTGCLRGMHAWFIKVRFPSQTSTHICNGDRAFIGDTQSRVEERAYLRAVLKDVGL